MHVRDGEAVYVQCACAFVCAYISTSSYVCVCVKHVGLKRPNGRKSALHAALHQELLAAAANSSPAAAATTTNPSPAAAATTTNPSPAAAAAATNPSPTAAAATTPPPPAAAAATTPPPPAAPAATNSSPAAAAATTNPSPAAAAATTNSSPAVTANSTSDSEWIFPHEIGDRVEVHWPAEKQWFVADIADTCDEEEQFLVHYIDDDEEHWHPYRETEVRKYHIRTR